MPTDPRFDGPGPEASWRARLEEGEFTLQTCPSCRVSQFPPTVVCRACGGPAGSLHAASGHGTVYATTTIRKREGARNVALVQLAEGPRLMSRVTGDPEAVVIGTPVRARIEQDDEPVLIFDPVERK